MIAEDVVHGDSMLCQIIEQGKGFKVVFWKNDAVFEPEFKQVTQDIECIHFWSDIVEEFPEYPRPIGIILPDVGIAHKNVHGVIIVMRAGQSIIPHLVYEGLNG
jgi:hypothetical protein